MKIRPLSTSRAITLPLHILAVGRKGFAVDKGVVLPLDGIFAAVGERFYDLRRFRASAHLL